MLFRRYGVWGIWLVLTVTGIPVTAETLTGRVIAVVDGDTLTLRVEGRDPVTVRLAGIDAPKFNE